MHPWTGSLLLPRVQQIAENARMPGLLLSTVCFALVPGLLWARLASSCAVADESPSARFQNDASTQTIKRLEIALLRQPRPGTLFDRVMQWHADNDSVSDYIQRLTLATEHSDHAAQLLLGLVLAQQDRPADALPLLQAASIARPTDPIARWHLGNLQLRSGQPAAATQSLLQALQLKPAAADLPNLSRDCATALRQSATPAQLAEFWTSLPQQFPRNRRLTELAATQLMNNGFHAESLTTFQTLLDSEQDPAQIAAITLQIAQLHVLMQHPEPALETLENGLNNLAADGWLARQFLGEIQRLPQFSEQPDRLTQWYQQRLRRSPDDQLVLEKLVRLQIQSGQLAAADSQIKQSLTQFPDSQRLQRLEIEVAESAGRFTDAERLFRTRTDSPQTTAADLQDFAAFQLRRADLPAPQRRILASELWQRAAQLTPSVNQLLQLAERQRQIEQYDAAETLLQQALQLQPHHPATCEALARLLLLQNRRDAALTALQNMAAGTQRNATSLQDLARCAMQYGFPEAAIAAAADAAQLDPDPAQLLKLCRLLRGSVTPLPASTAEQCLRLLEQADSVSESFPEAARIVEEKVLVLQAAGQTDRRLQQLLTTLSRPEESAPVATAQLRSVIAWFEVATLQRTLQNPNAALESLRNALRLQPTQPLLLQTTATLCQEQGLLADALQLHQQCLLAAPEQRASCLPQIARLQLLLGHRDAAASTMLQLDAATDISPQLAIEAADTLTEAGRRSDAVRLLRQATSNAPEDSDLHLALCEQLWATGNRSAALQSCWQAFDTSSDETRLLTLANTLVSLHTTADRLDQLHDSIRQRSQQPAAEPSVLRRTMLLADAADLPDIARECRAALLETTAATFDDQVAAATQLIAAGDSQAGFEILQKLDHGTRSETECARIAACAAELPATLLDDWLPTPLTASLLWNERLQNLDTLLQQQRWQQALQLCQSLAANEQYLWPVELRTAVCEWHLNNHAAATSRLQRLIQDVDLPKPAANPAQLIGPTEETPTQTLAPLSFTRGTPASSFWVVVFENSTRIFLDNASSAGSQQPTQPLSPAALRQAELTALCGLLLAESQGFAPDVPLRLQTTTTSPATAARRLWAWRRLKSVRDGRPAALRADSFQLLRLGDPEGPPAVLAELPLLAGTGNSSPLQLLQDSRQPLTEEQSQLAIQSLAQLADSLPTASLLTCLQQIAAGSEKPPAPPTPEQAAVSSETLLLQLLNAAHARRSNGTPPPLHSILQAAAELLTQRPQAGFVKPLLAAEISQRDQISPDDLQAAGEFWVQHGSLLNTDTGPLEPYWYMNSPATTQTATLHPDQLSILLEARDRHLLTAIAAKARSITLPGTLTELQQLLDLTTAQPELRTEAVRRCLLWLVLNSTPQTAAPHHGLQQLELLLPTAWQPLWLHAVRLEQHGADAEALAVINNMTTTDPRIQRGKALTVLRLAARLGQPEPARQAWQILAGMQLTVDERRECSRQLRLCGLADEYHALVQRSSPEFSEARLRRLQDELNMYQSAGRLQEARELAERILQQPEDGSVRFRRHGRLTADDLRRQARSILQSANSAVSAPKNAP